MVTTSLLKRCIATLPWVRFINLYSVSECHDVACVDLSEYYAKSKVSTCHPYRALLAMPKVST